MPRTAPVARALGAIMADGATHDHCRKEIQRLKEENELLRRSARSFGELAERLHRELERERWSGSDCAGVESPRSDLHPHRSQANRTSLPR